MIPAGKFLLDTTYWNRVLWAKVAVYFIIVGGWLFVCLLTDSETKTKRGERQTVSKIEMGLHGCDDPSRCWTKRWNTVWKATEGAKDVKPQTDVRMRDCKRLHRWMCGEVHQHLFNILLPLMFNYFLNHIINSHNDIPCIMLYQHILISAQRNAVSHSNTSHTSAIKS